MAWRKKVLRIITIPLLPAIWQFFLFFMNDEIDADS